MDHCKMNVDSNAGDSGGKSMLLKQFVSAAREYVAFHSEKSLCTMNRYLALIASSDMVTFSPGRLEVSSFLGSLWDVMSLATGPHWQGVAVLSRIVKDPSARQALVQTYKFLPILVKLLTADLSNEKRLQLLLLMVELTFGIKINYQESYLPKLIQTLVAWVMEDNTDNMQLKKAGSLALNVLVNLCYGNLQVIYTLMRTIDTRQLIKKLVSMKDDGSGGVQVCRLLMSLQGTQGAPTSQDVHNFLAVTLQAFLQGIKDCDASQLRHASQFLHDLCTDSQTKSHVMSYERFHTPLEEAVKYFPLLLAKTSGDQAESEGNMCLENTLNFLLTLVKTELYSLRPFYNVMCELCMNATHITVCLSPVFGLLAAIISQFHEDGMLPDDVMAVISTKITNLLAPTPLDAKTCGLEWLQMVSALCECNATQCAIIQNVKTEQFEEILYQILQSATQKGSLDTCYTYDSVLVSCSLCLDLAQISSPWDGVLYRMLSNNSIQKVLSSCLSGDRRKQALSIIKHPRFPIDKINQVFCAVESMSDHNTSGDGAAVGSKGYLSSELPLSQSNNVVSPQLSFSQEKSLDELIQRLNQVLNNNQIEDMPTSSIMELYSYKVSCLEQRLHASSTALQGATHNIASLNHSMALLQSTNKSQQDVLYRTILHNEKLKENVSRLSEQLSNAEQSIKRFQGKLAAERLDRDQQAANIKHKHAQKIKELETEIDNKESQLTYLKDKFADSEACCKSLQQKLTEQTNKNSELAGVLVKFEERVKQRDKKLEETINQNSSVKNDLTQAQQTIKSLEKTLLEREKRLTQLTSQLEEMTRIQEIIANLMGNKAASTNSSNNSMN